MTDKGDIKIFENKNVRTFWDAENEAWYFSAVDVCCVLSDSASKDSGAYWRKLKQRLKKEGSEVVTNCHGLKLSVADFYSTKLNYPNIFVKKHMLQLPSETEIHTYILDKSSKIQSKSAN